jgi:2-keto-4-pentenoate hydratase/2-oxohepta-3-ene-1,7-dioic acid hydratase in catechol pathway
MLLVKFSADDVLRVGAVSDGRVVELVGAWSDILGQFSGGVAGRPVTTGREWPLDRCALRAPLPDTPRPIFCLGMNYVAHAAEAGKPLGAPRPAQPLVFVKQADAMADPGEAVHLDSELSTEFDWEAELAVIIGRSGRHIAPGRVRDHVAGYTVLNDVTARDAQRAHVQWFLGKNVQRSSPVGPWVATADDIAYPPDLELTMTVNGVEKQRARTSELIFDVDTFVSTVSRYVQLEVGDVFATGTPAGVGFTRTPPEFLRAGDVMVAEIESIGQLRNTVT